jgi:DNA (cytosine-5)-methyltransferase 1
MNKIKVAELFAGVGGFRLGLEGWNGKSAISGYKKNIQSQYEVVWSNQWEPSTKLQHANLVYQNRWGDMSHSGQDISTVKTIDIPNHDLLVGGFPCQDYSVATTLKNSGGLVGKKGVLWWEIHRILKEKGDKKPQFLFLENVDRLLKSPAKQRGRDFAMILGSLGELGYAVEWRVINAAEYGFPQRRRRTFILAYHKSSKLYKKFTNDFVEDWICQNGVIAKSFPITLLNQISSGEISSDLLKISNEFGIDKSHSPFENSGVYYDGFFHTAKSIPQYDSKYMTLGDVLEPLNNVDEEFHILPETWDKWVYLKGAKNEQRYNKAQDFYYQYNEGGMIFPDALDRPSRTIITGEGGKSASRFKHVICHNGVNRRLTPIELERLNMFPDDHTKLEGITATKRAFFMGNALVVGVIEKIGNELFNQINE